MRGRVLILSVISIFFRWCVFGQELLPTLHDTTEFKHQIKLNGMVFQHGTSLKNDLSRKLMFGGEIDNDLAKDAYSSQKDINRLGGGYFAEVEYRASTSVFKSNPNWSWMISLSDNAHISGVYSDKLFGLAFLGNESFLGEGIPLSGTEASYERFLSIGGGFHNVKSKSFITINAVLPEDYFQLSVNRGSIHFSELGDEVSLEAMADITQANTKNHFKGLGAAVDFGFNIPFQVSEKFKGVINISGRNVGFYSLHNAKLSSFETKYKFTGFSIDEIINNGFDDLLDTLSIETETKSRVKMLPGYLQAGKIASVNDSRKVQSFFGVRMYMNNIYKPMVYVGVHYQPIQQFSIGAQGSFGGYGNFRLGMYASYSMDNLLISLGTEDLLGAILKSQYGHSGLIKVIWRL